LLVPLLQYASLRGPDAPSRFYLGDSNMDWKSVTSKGDDAVSIPKRWLYIHYYEALNILFRMENALRVFVYAILKNEYQEKWADATVQT
jgi:hypothetical protein